MNDDEVGKVVISTPSKEVKNQPKVEVAVKKPVKVYKNSQSIKAHIQLPESVIEEPALAVLSSVKVKDDGYPHSVTTVINTETGETQTYTKTEPLPWFEFKNSGEAGVYTGIKNGTPTIRLDVREDLFSVKSINFSLRGSIDQGSNGQTDVFVGVGAAYRW